MTTGMKEAACAFRQGDTSGFRALTSLIKACSSCVLVSIVGANCSSRAKLPKKSQMKSSPNEKRCIGF